MKSIRKLLLGSLLALGSYQINYAQQHQAPSAVDPRIEEVYGEHLPAILAHDPERLRVLNDLLTNRLEVRQMPYDPKEKITSLAAAPLFNRYNSQIAHSATYNASTFNILRYNVPLYLQYDEFYRIDSNHVVLIKGFKTLK